MPTLQLGGFVGGVVGGFAVLLEVNRAEEFSTTILTGGYILRKCSKSSYGAELRVNLMALSCVPVFTQPASAAAQGSLSKKR